MDAHETLYFYRHSDGYLEGAGESLREFIQGYAQGMRLNAGQSAGWLIIQGANEYGLKARPDGNDRFSGWKVGAYEPSSGLASDAEYVYVIDLVAKKLKAYSTRPLYANDPTLSKCDFLPEFTTEIQGGAA